MSVAVQNFEWDTMSRLVNEGMSHSDELGLVRQAPLAARQVILRHVMAGYCGGVGMPRSSLTRAHRRHADHRSDTIGGRSPVNETFYGGLIFEPLPRP